MYNFKVEVPYFRLRAVEAVKYLVVYGMNTRINKNWNLLISSCI